MMARTWIDKKYTWQHVEQLANQLYTMSSEHTPQAPVTPPIHTLHHPNTPPPSDSFPAHTPTHTAASLSTHTRTVLDQLQTSFHQRNKHIPPSPRIAPPQSIIPHQNHPLPQHMISHPPHAMSTPPISSTSSHDSSHSSMIDLQSTKRKKTLQVAPWHKLQHTFLQHHHYQQKIKQQVQEQQTQEQQAQEQQAQEQTVSAQSISNGT